MKPRIKICCIRSIEEANTAIEFGASAIGLVARMPSGPGPIPDGLIKQIATTVPPPGDYQTSSTDKYQYNSNC
jgi:phosphoribosylanthranilate isomerase